MRRAACVASTFGVRDPARSSAISCDLMRSTIETFLLDQESSAVLYNCISPVTRNLRGPMTWRDADDGCAARGHRGHGPEDSRGCGPRDISGPASQWRGPAARQDPRRESSQQATAPDAKTASPLSGPDAPPPARAPCACSPHSRGPRAAPTAAGAADHETVTMRQTERGYVG